MRYFGGGNNRRKGGAGNSSVNLGNCNTNGIPNLNQIRVGVNPTQSISYSVLQVLLIIVLWVYVPSW